MLHTSVTSFVTIIYRTLLPRQTTNEDLPKCDHIVKGYLGRAIGKHSDMFENQFVQLDTHTGLMHIFEGAYSPCLEEHELRFA